MDFCLIIIVSTTLIYSVQASCSGGDCGSCVAGGRHCAWCSMKEFSSPRCQTEAALEALNCSSIEQPAVSPTPEVTKNEAVGDGDAAGGRPVQIQPQQVRVSGRPGSKHRLSMTFRAPNNYPVDLYFLFDVSQTMKTQIEKLAQMALGIGKAIGNITTNYTMGYGIFQDKVAMPFTDTSEKKLKDPCLGARNSCTPPFEFRHLLNLTSNVTEFSQTVRASKSQTTGNIDHPEGGCDAMLQAMVCGDVIGWRSEARKLLIYASDDRFHLAGAGRLAGIVTPNDGRCHLSHVAGYVTYDMETVLDYPSAGQLSAAAGRHSVHVILAVAGVGRKLARTKRLYEHLSARIKDSVVRSLNASDNNNIMDIVVQKYKSMVNEVTIDYTRVPGVDITVQATSPVCKQQGGPRCEGIQIGQPVTFDVTVEVKECQPDNVTRVIRIGADFMQEADKLQLALDVHCDCGCMHDSSSWEYDSAACGGNGTLKCGTCHCHEGRRGAQCQCSVEEAGGAAQGCLVSDGNSTVTEECGGRGYCSCDTCVCDEGYSGPQCECVQDSCGRLGGQLCGGAARGVCNCGVCVCTDQYTGSVCQCPTSNMTCADTEGGLCHNHGECRCGKCHCHKGHIGELCERSLASDDICDFSEYRACAECIFSGDTTCSSTCPVHHVVDSVSREAPGACHVVRADGCIMSYQVLADGISVQRTSECPEEVDVVPIIAGTVAGIVGLVLLVVLLLRLCVWFYDKREYAKWEEDKKTAKWAQQDNPVYKGATSYYKNPIMDAGGDDLPPFTDE